MKRTLVIITATATLLSAAALPASAQDVTDGEAPVTATLTGVLGTRSIVTVAPVAIASVLNGLPTGDYTVEVAEASRTGTNPWSVTGRLCGPDNATTPTASDCTTHPDTLVKSGDAATTLPGSALDLSNLGVIELVPGGSGDLTAGSDADLSAARTLFTNDNQSNSQLYTETYTSTGDITVTAPDGTEITTYVGYFVVTLVQ